MDATTGSETDFYPPYGLTGVETGVVGLSWASGSVRGDWTDHGRAEGWRLRDLLAGYGLNRGVLESANRHYEDGIRAEDWSWSIGWAGRGGASGSVWVEVRQSPLEALGSASSYALGNALALTLDLGRVDLAADDARPVAPDPRAYFDRLRTGSARTRLQRRNIRLELSADGGQVLRLGSRSSDRYGRIYVKPGYGVRHELELKRDLARSAGSVMASGGSLAGLYVSEYSRLVSWPS